MHPIKIKSVEEIKNKEVVQELKDLTEGQVILIFTDGTYTKIPEFYEGQLKDINNNEVLTLNPINTYWRPLWVGIRLFNTDYQTNSI